MLSPARGERRASSADSLHSIIEASLRVESLSGIRNELPFKFADDTLGALWQIRSQMAWEAWWAGAFVGLDLVENAGK